MAMSEDQRAIAERFVSLFQGEGSAYGTEAGGCVREPVTWQVIEDHLFGEYPIGVYPMHQNYVRWGCVDYDEGDDVSFQKARRLSEALATIGIPAYLEKSRSKGWHVWVFAASAVPAATMRRALIVATKVANAESKEVNPKAETLPEGSLGNYVRLPYPNGYDSDCSLTLQDPADGWGRRCIWRNFTIDWMPIDLESFLDTVMLASPSQLELAAGLYQPPPSSGPLELGDDPDEPTELIKMLDGLAYTIWKDGPLQDGDRKPDRSNTLVRLCALCLAQGFTGKQAKAIIASADRRWGKYLNRPVPAMHEIDKIVERIYS